MNCESLRTRHSLALDPEYPNYIIMNTCTFTSLRKILTTSVRMNAATIGAWEPTQLATKLLKLIVVPAKFGVRSMWFNYWRNKLCARVRIADLIQITSSRVHDKFTYVSVTRGVGLSNAVLISCMRSKSALCQNKYICMDIETKLVFLI